MRRFAQTESHLSQPPFSKGQDRQKNFAGALDIAAPCPWLTGDFGSRKKPLRSGTSPSTGTTEVEVELSDTEGPSCHAGTAAPSPSPGAVGLHTCVGAQPPFCRASQLSPANSRQITSLGQAEPSHHLPATIIYMVLTARAAINRSHGIKQPLNAPTEYPITRQAFRISSEQTHKQQHTIKGF